MKHMYETHESCGDTDCLVCVGGLVICTTCGGMEGSLTTDCCGHRLTDQNLQWVYEGEVDYRVGGWVNAASVHSPNRGRVRLAVWLYHAPATGFFEFAWSGEGAPKGRMTAFKGVLTLARPTDAANVLLGMAAEGRWDAVGWSALADACLDLGAAYQAHAGEFRALAEAPRVGVHVESWVQVTDTGERVERVAHGGRTP